MLPLLIFFNFKLKTKKKRENRHIKTQKHTTHQSLKKLPAIKPHGHITLHGTPDPVVVFHVQSAPETWLGKTKGVHNGNAAFALFVRFGIAASFASFILTDESHFHLFLDHSSNPRNCLSSIKKKIRKNKNIGRVGWKELVW